MNYLKQEIFKFSEKTILFSVRNYETHCYAIAHLSSEVLKKLFDDYLLFGNIDNSRLSSMNFIHNIVLEEVEDAYQLFSKEEERIKGYKILDRNEYHLLEKSSDLNLKTSHFGISKFGINIQGEFGHLDEDFMTCDVEPSIIFN